MYFIWEGAEKVFPLRRIWEGFFWCRTYTPFEKELRRYFHLRRLNIFQHFDLRRHWEGFLFEKDLRSMELLQSSGDGFEKVRWIWEGNVPSQKYIHKHLQKPFVYCSVTRTLIIFAGTQVNVTSSGWVSESRNNELAFSLKDQLLFS